MDALCSNINGDAPLFSMFRVGARPVTCPFKNPPFSVVYNKGHGDCGAKDGEPPSKAESCTDDTRLVFKFQACPDVPGTEAAGNFYYLNSLYFQPKFDPGPTGTEE